MSSRIMMLVYSSKITSRLRYTLDLLLGKLLGLSFELTSDIETYLNFKGALINYSKKSISDGELHVLPSGFLDMRGIQPLVPEVKIIDGLAVLFPSRRTDDKMGFDPFSAGFYLVSRYEEYLPFNPDEHGRFQASESIAFKNDFLEIPVVNYYALKIKDALLECFPFMEFTTQQYIFHPSYDVDVAYAFRGRGGVRSVFGMFKSIINGDLKAVTERFRVLLNRQNDPFDTYDYQLSIHKKHNLRAFYFFLCGDFGLFDKNISYFSLVFQKLVKKISDYAYTGIHPSYLAHDEPQRLTEEIRRLGNIMNREIRYSRQHYLRLSFPTTYRNLINNEINHDFTMGYASLPGFRAGICTPYYFYDIEKEAVSNLIVCPFAVMDVTLRNYMKLNPQQAVQTISRLVSEVKKVNGTFISLWHNESLSENAHWKGWKEVYEQLVSMSLPHNKQHNDTLPYTQ